MSYLKKVKIDTEKAAILIISLWILAILSMFAIGIGHKLSVEIRLLRNQIDDAKAFYIAKAGVMRAIAERASVIKSSKRIYADCYHRTWMNSKDIFKAAKFGDGAYTVINEAAEGLYGMTDEKSKININKANINSLTAFLKDIEAADPVGIAANIVDWRDKDNTVTQTEGIPAGGAEDIVDPPYHPKNADFVAVEELLLVRGVTQELYDKMKDYVTVYTDGLININTAPQPVLVSVLESATATYVLDARQGVEDNPAQKWFVNTADTLTEDIGNIINLNFAKGETETALKNKLTDKAIDVKSEVFKIYSIGEVRGIKSSIVAVVKFKDDDGTYDFLSWRQR